MKRIKQKWLKKKGYSGRRRTEKEEEENKSVEEVEGRTGRGKEEGEKK